MSCSMSRFEARPYRLLDRRRGHRLTLSRLYEAKLPIRKRFDRLVILGGPMNIHEEAAYPWLVEEKAADPGQRWRPANPPWASAIGRSCSPMDWVHGFTPAVTGKSAGFGAPDRRRQRTALTEGLPAVTTVFHWHGDTFDLPRALSTSSPARPAPTRPFSWTTASSISGSPGVDPGNGVVMPLPGRTHSRPLHPGRCADAPTPFPSGSRASCSGTCSKPCSTGCPGPCRPSGGLFDSGSAPRLSLLPGPNQLGQQAALRVAPPWRSAPSGHVADHSITSVGLPCSMSCSMDGRWW